jgi:hypothetical protein
MGYKFNIFTGTFDIVSAVASAVLARLAQNGDYRVDQAGNYRIDQSQ